MADEVGKIYITIDGRDVGVKDVIAAVDQRMRSLTNTSGVLDSAIAKTTAAHARQEQQILRNAQVMASLQSALGNNAAAAQTYANASSRMTAGSSAQIQADTGLANALNKVVIAEQEAERALIRKAQVMAKAQAASGNYAGASQTLQNALSGVNRQTQAALDAEAQLNTVTAKLAQQHQNAANQALRQAMAEARLSATSGPGGRQQGISNLQNAIQGSSADLMLQTKAQTQLNQMMSAGAVQGNTLVGTLKNIGTAALAAGTAFAAMQAVDFAKDAVNSANKLEKTMAVTKALSQTDAKYAEVLDIARRNQDKFGGSLQENMSALGKLVNISNRANTNLQQMDNIARRLSIVDPLQGFEGGVIALQEFMSGDIRSLAQRFELPRDALNSIKDMTGTYQDKLNALDQMLTKFGISNEVINAQLGTTARVYDQLASKADNAKVALGGVIAEALKVPAQGVGNFFQGIADGLNSFNKYAQGSAFSKIDADIFASTKNLEEFNTKLKEYQDRIKNMPSASEGGAGFDAKQIALSKLKEMTTAQYQFAMQVRATGAEWDVVAQKVREADSLFQGTAELVKIRGEDVATADALASSLMFLASTSSSGAAKARELSNAVASGSVSAQMASIQANILANNTRILSEFKAKATSSAQGLSTAQKDEATTAAEDAINQEILKIKTELMGNAALEAANKIIATNGVMSLSGIQALQSSGQIDVLTAAYLRLANAKLQAEQGGGKGVSDTRKGASAGNDDLVSRAKGRAADDRIREENLKQREEEIKAEQEYQYHVGNTAQKLKILQDQLAKTTDVAEQYAIKQKIFDLQNQKGGSAAKLSAQEKLNNQLAGNQDSYYDKVENEELKHQQNVLKIQEEYAQKQLEAQKQNESDKRRSRYDFYSSLQDIPESDAQKYAAQYEEAFRKSQEMAQQGQQRLAKEYLDMRQKQIQEMKDLESEKRDVQENGDLSRKEKEAAIAYIESRKKMLEDAQKEEEKQLIEGGDANQKELQDRLADEDRVYADSLDRTGQRADQLADRRIAAWERANKKIAETPPAELTNLGGSAPTTEKTATAPTVSAANATPTTTSDIFIVRDQGVIDSIGDQTARLEGKLDALKSSVETGLSDVSRQVSDLKNRQRSMVGPGG